MKWVHSLVDDHSRLAYSELHRDEKAATVTGFVERGLAFFAAHEIEVKRLMSDNAWTYTRNLALAELLDENGIRHLLIPYRRPQVNGKVERYQQTLKRESALGQVYRSSAHRAQALSHWVSYYNQHRPHSSLGGRPPSELCPQRPEAGHLGGCRARWLFGTVGDPSPPSNSTGMDERSERMALRFEVPILVAAVLVIPVIVIEESSVGRP